EIETRIKELLEIVNNSNNATEIDGEALTQVIRNQKIELDKLGQRVAYLEQENKNRLSLEDLKGIFGKNNFDGSGKYIGGSTTTQPPISTKPVDTPSSEEDAEKVYKNDYGSDKDLDALTINKKHLDTANSLFQEINEPTRNTFQKLPENFRAQEIQNLSNFDSQLPVGKKSTALKQAIKDRRNNFFYHLDELNNEIDGDGLTPKELTSQGGYEIDKETTPYSIRGKDYTGKQFNPDKIRDGTKYGEGNYIETNFCKMATTMSGNPSNFISRTQGLVPFPTASGKSTKFPYCMIRGGLENVILVVLDEGLLQDAYNHHTG
ncbi:18118_t:CDS:2, partial [Funneliformis geosporum]